VSDFFARLAARARGDAPVVRPRLPSRFEDAEPAAAPSEADHAAGWEEAVPAPRTLRRPAAIEETAVADPPRARPPRSVPAPPPTAPAASQAAPHPARRALAPEPADAPEPASAAAPPVVTAARAQAPRTAAEPEPQPRARAPREDVREPRLPRERAPLATPPEPSPRRDPVRTPRADDAQPARIAPRAAAPELPVIPRVVRTVTDVPAAIVPRVTRAVPERRPAQAAPPPAETTIHVTIGRIEVRAAAATASERGREAVPSAVMSLGDYLEARSGRARR
jgi:hypothetical protein